VPDQLRPGLEFPWPVFLFCVFLGLLVSRHRCRYRFRPGRQRERTSRNISSTCPSWTLFSIDIDKCTDNNCNSCNSLLPVLEQSSYPLFCVKKRKILLLYNSARLGVLRCVVLRFHTRVTQTVSTIAFRTRSLTLSRSLSFICLSFTPAFVE